MAVVLQALDLWKEYPGTTALADVSVSLEQGRVHALLGKNGAGKSTLVKILAGTTMPTRGRILVGGREVILHSAQDAFRHGIATVYQELSLITDLTVAENILLGRLPCRRLGCLRMVDWPQTYRRARAVLEEMQVEIDVRRRVSELSLGQQQVIEIAKAMSFRPSVLLLDEPTSALAHHETESLFSLVRQLASGGVAVLYITHRLQELPRIADSVIVLRDGMLVDVVEMAQATPDRIVRLMFGEAVPKRRPASVKPGSRVVLEARRLTRAHKFHEVDLTVHEGEVLGIAGMLGSGRTELLRALFGAEPPDAGEILLDGRVCTPRSPQVMKRHGLAFTPENRKEHGLVPILSTRGNMMLASLDSAPRWGLTTRRRERSIVQRLVSELSISVPDIEQPVTVLSGGNQQKVVIGKWLNTQPRVILFDEPTRGIDVQAKQQVFQIMWELSRRGICSIFVSSELEELVEACHRILIMRRGKIVEDVLAADITADELYRRCMDW